MERWMQAFATWAARLWPFPLLPQLLDRRTGQARSRTSDGSVR